MYLMYGEEATIITWIKTSNNLIVITSVSNKSVG